MGKSAHREIQEAVQAAYGKGRAEAEAMNDLTTIFAAYRKRLGTQAVLSFIEGARYFGGQGAETKHVLTAAERHRESVMADFESAVEVPLTERFFGAEEKTE